MPPQIVFKLFRKLAVVKCCDFLSLILYRALLLNPMYYFVSWIQALVLPFFEILPSTFSKEIVLLPSGSEAFSFTKLLPVSLTPYSASLCGPEPHVTCVILMAHGLLHQGVSYLEGGKHISCSLWWSLSLAWSLEAQGGVLLTCAAESQDPSDTGTQRLPSLDDAWLDKIPGFKVKCDDVINSTTSCWWCNVSLLSRMHAKGRSTGVAECMAWKHQRQQFRSKAVQCGFWRSDR